MNRVVMFVYNDCRSDSRVLREAASLVAAGHSVTIMARPVDWTATVGDREERSGFTIIRVPIPADWRARWNVILHPWRVRGPLRFLLLPWAALRLPFYLIARARRGATNGDRSTFDWLLIWRNAIVGWGDRAADAAPPADVCHAHDLTALAGGVRAARRHGARLVYDSHEVYLEAGQSARRPRWARAILGACERRWARDASALVTVNDAIAAELSERLHPRRIVVVHNCPPRWAPGADHVDRLREAAGIPTDARIALYHGGFAPHRGLPELAHALLEPGLERVHVVYLGYGLARPELDRLAADRRFEGRVHVLDAVPPDDLEDWVAGADVGVMPIQRSSLNHYLSTPNKLFECLAAGVPVVASDFPEMRRIVSGGADGPLGSLCDPADPADIGRAIRAILDLDAPAAAALRERCLRAAHERWNWETESRGLLDLYRDLETGVAVG